jgi:cyanate permease
VKILKIAPLFIAIGMQLYWLMPNLPLFLLAVPMVALGMGLSNPSVATLISKRTPPDIQGRTLGLSQSLGALARAISPGIAGWLYGAFPRAGGSVVAFVWGGPSSSWACSAVARSSRPRGARRRTCGAGAATMSDARAGPATRLRILGAAGPGSSG